MNDFTARRGRSLARRLAMWIALCTASSFLVFALVTYLVIDDELTEPEHRASRQLARDAAREVGDALLAASPLVLLLAVAGTVLITRRVLGPLEQVVAAAAAVSVHELDRRLPLPSTNDEVRRVVIAFNQLLARLESGFAALGRFATEASHELRTPLTVIGTELEIMLQKPRSSGEWETSARMCLDEVRHLTRLIEALLDMSRAEHDERSDDVDLDPIIAHVLHSAGARASSRGVALLTRRDPALRTAHVRGSQSALTSALLNIVDNAVRYTAPGSEVVVSLLDMTGKLCVQIDDSGPGVPPVELERIFEPFARGSVGVHADALTPDEQSSSGVGLGLTISRRILELHAAHITVDRSPTGGARFSIEFPMRSDRAATAPTAVTS
jgi:two-component system OmpR family sensor kinase